MDLNEKAVLFPHDAELRIGNTTLSLNGIGFGETNNTNYGCTESSLGMKFSVAVDDGCKLVLGLGPTPKAYGDDYNDMGFNKKKKPASLFSQSMPSECESILQLGLSGAANEISSMMEYSGSTETNVNISCFSSQTSGEYNYTMIPVVDEGSTSAKKSGGYMPSLLLAPRMDNAEISVQTQELILGTKSQTFPELSSATNHSLGTASGPQETGITSQNRTSNPKRCRYFGCSKGARGASGLCIGHGGGQRCQKPGCNKGAESRTAYCKAHGGGKRCQHLGCTKSAEGKTDYCIAHGGGRRCGYPGGCAKAARGKSGLCIRHGGGKRCTIEGCTRSAEGQAGLCISHGGGRRCQYHECSKGAQGSTMFCKAHGGGKRCSFAGCTKGAEGSTPLCKAHGGGKRCLFNGGGICPKSVHGGTNFCVAHGGGKRCAVSGCTKSARGRTDCCVRHGGGKRCKFESCGKSAQGSTDFCKAHGGGKRCNWGDGKCEKFARGKSGLCAAHCNLLQESEMSKGSLIAPGLFRGLVPSASTVCSSFENNNSSSGVSVVSDSYDSMETPRRHHLIPKEVLVPLSMKSPSYSNFLAANKPAQDRNLHSITGDCGGATKGTFDLPEGRVHGGPNPNNNNNTFRTSLSKPIWLLRRKCPCTGKKSVQVKEKKSTEIPKNSIKIPSPVSPSPSPPPPPPPMNNWVNNNMDQTPTLVTKSQRFQPVVTTLRVPYTEGFTFPVLNPNSTSTTAKPKNGVVLDDPPRESLEVFRPPDELNVDLKSLNFPFPPPMSRIIVDDGDAASDASSDLFEIESFSTATQSSYAAAAYRRNSRDSFDEGSVTTAMTECYEPSEASIEWSVTTADGYDESSYGVGVGGGGGSSGGGGVTAEHWKRKGGNGGLLVSCRCEKAVSVGPQPVKCEGQRGATSAGKNVSGGVNSRAGGVNKPPLARSSLSHRNNNNTPRVTSFSFAT